MPKQKSLRQWRNERKESQKEAACAIGVHPVTWSEYERGKMTPSITVVRRMAEHFGCTSDDILLSGAA